MGDRIRRSIALLVVVLGAGCGDDAASPPSERELSADVLVDGLVGPTQITPDGSGGYVVAELNGGEREGAGRVLRFESLDSEPEVVLEGLLTPTGVAVDGGQLWVMERRTLSVGPLDDPSDRRTVLTDLPYNGRSEGTISTVEGGGILYDTSGARSGDELAPGSGTLWFLAGPDADPEPFATGFKHAYAHAPAGGGRWFVTEISDGLLDGRPPPDELVVAARGDDFAYPRCVGDRTPVAGFGVTDAECAGTPRSHALFAPRSTPTSVVVAPWDAATVLVALWVSGEVVAVPADTSGAPHEPRVIFDGVEHPQHLLADGDRVLLVDHGEGRIIALAPDRSA